MSVRRGASRFVIGYLWLVVPHFGRMTVAVAAVTAVSVSMLVLQPSDGGAAYLPLLAVQLFAASSGYRQLADNGQFDGLLTAGISRIYVGLVHCCLSACPGAVAWGLVAIVEQTLTGGGRSLAAHVPPLVGWFLISATAWAASLPTARLFGGSLWILGVVGLGASVDGRIWLAQMMTATPTTLSETLEAAFALFACPVLFLAPTAVSAAHWGVLAATCAVATGMVAGGVFWISVKPYPCIR